MNDSVPLYMWGQKLKPLDFPAKEEIEMPEEEQGVIQGAFLESLKRNNLQIREDRATSIVEDAHLIYSREIEDLALHIKKLKREQENMLDLSPTHADSLVLASDFDAKEYVTKDLEISVKIRNMGMVPESIVKKTLPDLMGSLLEAGIADPQVLFLGLGDFVYDQAPLQVGQFESSAQLLDRWLTKVYLEGGGGGNNWESYNLAYLVIVNYLKPSIKYHPLPDIRLTDNLLT